MTNARCCIRKTSIRLKYRIGPETDARRIAKIATTAKLMGVPVRGR